MENMFGKFLIKFTAWFVFTVIFLEIFFIILGVTQYFTMIKRVDCQVMAAFECAVRTTQSSVHETNAATDANNIQSQNPEYYKFYYDDFSNPTVYSQEFTEYLEFFRNKNDFKGAYDLLTNEESQKLVGLVPMDLALPYVNLDSTGKYDKGLKEQMQDCLMQTLQPSSEDFQLVGVQMNSIHVDYDPNYNSQSECLKVTNSLDDILKYLGPVYLDDTFMSGSQIVQNGYHIPYYDLKVTVSFDSTLNIPVLSTIDPNNRLIQTFSFSKEYALRYSLLN